MKLALLVNGSWFRAGSPAALLALVKKARPKAETYEYYEKEAAVIGIAVRMRSGVYYHYEGLDYEKAFYLGDSL